MILLVILALSIAAAEALTSQGVSPIVATFLSLPLACALWFGGCFAYGGIVGVIGAFRFSFRKDRI